MSRWVNSRVQATPGCAMLVVMAVLLGTMCPRSQAEADDLQAAVTSFPQLRPQVYNPEVAARCANLLIRAGEGRACTALLEAVKDRPGDWKESGTVNLQVCHLCRLLFTSTNSSQPLRRPALGAIQGFPAERIIREPPEWPDLPFVVANGIPLSLCQGYAGSGVREMAEHYIDYCRANGRFRTNLFAVPTTITASNALMSVFASPAWRGLSRKDEAWSFNGNENEAKKSFWAQINNLANPAVQRREEISREPRMPMPERVAAANLIVLGKFGFPGNTGKLTTTSVVVDEVLRGSAPSGKTLWVSYTSSSWLVPEVAAYPGPVAPHGSRWILFLTDTDVKQVAGTNYYTRAVGPHKYAHDGFELAKDEVVKQVRELILEGKK